jgi:hypothetical protein
MEVVEEPQPPAQPPAQPRADGATGGRRRTHTITGVSTPHAALPPTQTTMKVGRIVAPKSAAAQSADQEQERDAQSAIIQEGLDANDAQKRGGDAMAALPPWRRIGGEEFDRRAQLKDSFAMIWNRERGLHSEQGSKKGKGGSTGSFVYTWGMGYHGQLGKKYARGEIRMSLEPNLVSLPSGVAACQVACGAFHTMVLTLDGRVFSWGEGRNGQLGYACLAKQETPLEVTDIDPCCGAYLAAGRHHSAMIDRNGGLWCWGHGKQGQLGDGERPSARHMPKKLTKYNREAAGPARAHVADMPATLRFRQLACGARHTAAVSTDGELFTFGSGKQGQLGHGVLEDEVFPTKVDFFSTGVRAIPACQHPSLPAARPSAASLRPLPRVHLRAHPCTFLLCFVR